jgi:hypothetical protein
MKATVWTTIGLLQALDRAMEPWNYPLEPNLGIGNEYLALDYRHYRHIGRALPNCPRLAEAIVSRANAIRTLRNSISSAAAISEKSRS